MSTFASSVINKSGRKLAPKIPVRRPGISAQPSRASVESVASQPAQLAPTRGETSSTSQTPTFHDELASPAKPSPFQSQTESVQNQPTEGSTLIPTSIVRKRAPSPSPSATVPVVRIDESRRRGISSPRSTRRTVGEVKESQSHDVGDTRTNQVELSDVRLEPPSKRQKTGTSTSKRPTGTNVSSEELSTTDDRADERAALPKSQAQRHVKRKEDENAEIAPATLATDAVTGEKPNKRRKKRRHKTPENAEAIQIVPAVVKMADLCKDLHTGKKSSREAELQSMNWAELARKKKQDRMSKTEAAKSTIQNSAEPGDQPTPHNFNPQYRLVNGLIVLDNASLQVDRHAEIVAHTADLDVVEENPLTKKVNSASWSKKTPAVSWDEENTALFYQGLRMFGTDFGSISKMFFDRSRRSIKLKFTNEERRNPQRITETLLGPREKVDMEQYSSMTNTVYGDPSVLEKLLEEDRRKIEAQHLLDQQAHELAQKQLEEERDVEGSSGNAADSLSKKEGPEKAQPHDQKGSVVVQAKPKLKDKQELSGSTAMEGEFVGTVERPEFQDNDLADTPMPSVENEQAFGRTRSGRWVSMRVLRSRKVDKAEKGKGKRAAVRGKNADADDAEIVGSVGGELF